MSTITTEIASHPQAYTHSLLPVSQTSGVLAIWCTGSNPGGLPHRRRVKKIHKVFSGCLALSVALPAHFACESGLCGCPGLGSLANHNRETPLHTAYATNTATANTATDTTAGGASASITVNTVLYVLLLCTVSTTAFPPGSSSATTINAQVQVKIVIIV